VRPTSGSANDAQADYYLEMLTARWQALETEIVERCNELRRLSPAARKAERGRNIRRVIKRKQAEVASVREMCAALVDRAEKG
jgi:hypothetical protein